LLSAAAHFSMLLSWDKYTSDLAKGMNHFRWIEYSLSSSLILSLLFIVWLNFDFVQLSGTFTINACMCLFGDMHERINAGRAPAKVDWTAFTYGSFVGIVSWCWFWYTVITSPYVGDYPWYAWAYSISYFVLFFSFPSVMFFQYTQVGKFNNSNYPDLTNGGYLYGERVYMILSLSIKSMLLWMVAGAMFSSSSADWADIG